MTIPASDIVNVTPNVLSAGGAALDLNGLMLTSSTRPPIGSVQAFVTAAAVSDYFGPDSNEAAKAAVYFNGFDNSNKKPGALLMAQYPVSAVAAYVRGGNASGLSLAALQALNGTLSLVVDGSEQSATVNLSSALSFSAAAAVIETALNTATAATGSVAANVVVGRIDPTAGTGSIAGTTLTLSAVTRAGFAPGQAVLGTGVADGTTIVEQLTGGTAGGTGTYQVSISQTVASTAITTNGGTMVVSAVTTGTLFVGQTLSGAGVTAGTKISAFLTGTGGTGTYAVDTVQTVAAATTITGTGGTLTISAVSAGSFGLGDVFTGTGVTAGNTITGFLTGTGLTGTYLCSVGDTAGSTAISVAGASVDVSYDSVSGGFIIQSGTTGTNSTVTAPTGTLAAPLFLTVATGAVLSQGAAATSPAAFMNGIVQVTQNWATFMTLFNPDTGTAIDNRLAFAAWTNGQNNRYAYVCWDHNISPSTTVPATASLGYAIAQANYSGTCLVWEPADYSLAAFVLGTAASIDFTEAEGRITFKFRSQSGLTPGVTDQQIASNLTENGYNFYGAYATANQGFQFLANGVVSGPFQWMDSYVNEIWLNNALQLALMNLLVQVKSIPYNTAGYTLMEAACQDPINGGLNFGAIRAGVPLSSQQAAEVNNAARTNISDTLSTRGWYLQILPATAQVRQARQSPPSKFWYMDGQSVQQIDLTSILVQ